NNSCNGEYCLKNLTTASNNVAFGISAGRFISDGATSNTTTANSVFIGAASYPLADGDTNESVFGYQAVGAGSNTGVWGNASVTDVYLGSATGAANVHAKNFQVGSSSGVGNVVVGNHLNQLATRDFAGSCTMSATTCTVPFQNSWTSTPVCVATVQGGTPYYASVSVSSNIATITANVSNAAIWNVICAGNPN